jgi:hypothetical protein
MSTAATRTTYSHALGTHCWVSGCKRPAERDWEVPLCVRHGQTLPVCGYHSRRDLWFYRGRLYDSKES